MPEVRLRSEAWLQDRATGLQARYFADVQGGHPIVARFGRRAVHRWGTIHADHGHAIITLNALFALPDVPEVVLDATIVHELAHYAHGYGSGLRKKHRHPHVGGVVEAELEKRGCLHLDAEANAWLKANWHGILDRYAADLAAVRQRRPNAGWAMYLALPECRHPEELAEIAQRAAAAFGLDACPFRVGWLEATKRQIAMSYRRPSDGLVQLHGLLARRAVPDAVLLCEIGIWLIAPSGRCTASQLTSGFSAAGLTAEWKEAEAYRSKKWPRMCRVHHHLWK